MQGATIEEGLNVAGTMKNWAVVVVNADRTELVALFRDLPRRSLRLLTEGNQTWHLFRLKGPTSTFPGAVLAASRTPRSKRRKWLVLDPIFRGREARWVRTMLEATTPDARRESDGPR